MRRYPYGPYAWSWWNYDSGATSKNTVREDKKVGKQLFRTRSNFDAALGSLNELCRTSLITGAMREEAHKEFCTDRATTTVRPYLESAKADALYIPGNDLGVVIMHAIALMMS
jgi:hypothetical protein